MARYLRRESKIDDAGVEVILYQDEEDGSWCVGRAGDMRTGPVPMAAFVSEEAARRWADQQFGGGIWQRDAEGELRI